jgi:hypothetical protein
LGSELSEMLTDQALQAMDAVEYITEHLRRDNVDKKIREEWRFVAMVNGSIQFIFPLIDYPSRKCQKKKKISGN